MTAKFFFDLILVSAKLTIIMCIGIIAWVTYYFISRFIIKRRLCRYIRRNTKLEKILKYFMHNSDVNLFATDDEFADHIVSCTSFVISHIIQNDTKIKYKRFYSIPYINISVFRILDKINKYKLIMEQIYDYYNKNYDEYIFDSLLKSIYGDSHKRKLVFSMTENDSSSMPSDIVESLVELEKDDYSEYVNLQEALDNVFLE